MIGLRIGQWGAGDPLHHDSLSTVKTLIEMDVEAADVGWGEEPARLFSIDTAMLVLRRNVTRLDELDRQALSNRLHEARRLVIAGREGELGFLQNELESYLTHSWSSDARGIWITALNALLPSPYRAAETAVATALEVDRAGSVSDLAEVLRQRLRARLSEGSLLAEETSSLFATA